MLDKLEKMLTPGKEQELFQAIVDARAKYAPHEDEFLKIAERADYATAKDVHAGARAAGAAQIPRGDQGLQQLPGGAEQPGRPEANASYKTTVTIVFALAVLGPVRGGGGVADHPEPDRDSLVASRPMPWKW